ncbi:MAG: homocysteine S-methyltransferase [Ancrocorticia sp.]
MAVESFSNDDGVANHNGVAAPASNGTPAPVSFGTSARGQELARVSSTPLVSAHPASDSPHPASDSPPAEEVVSSMDRGLVSASHTAFRSFQERLRESSHGMVLDGGLGTHLADRGNDISDALWSARILRNNPDEVRAAHEDFFRAGAQVATTCSYQVTFDGLAQAGASRAETEELLRASVRLAREAAESIRDAPRLVAASIGPYGAGPGQGTEYDGAYRLTAAELAAWHRPRLEILANTDADFLLAETIPSILEVEALTSEFARIEKPAILSITVADGRLRDGSSLEDVATIVSGSKLAGLGINCCTTADALTALRVLAPLCDLPMAVYPNSGESWDHVVRQWMGDEEEISLISSVPALIAAGAHLIGGCCRVTPQHIAAIAAHVCSQRGADLSPKN